MTRIARKTLVRRCLGTLLLLLGCANSRVALSQEQPEEAAPDHVKPQSVETVDVETEKYEIQFSTAECSPLQWDILLPPRQDDLQPRQRFAMIDRSVVDVLQHLPLRFGLDLANTVVETTNKDNVHLVRCEGRLVDRKLIKVLQTYRIPADGYVSTITISLFNEGATTQTFDEGLSLSLGAGLGSPAVLLHTQAFVNIEGQGTFNIEPPEGDSPSSLGPLRWAGLHNRYYTLALIPKGHTRFSESRVVVDAGLADSGLIEPSRLLGFPSLELWSEPFSLPPGESVEHDFLLFAGPRGRHLLREAQAGLEESIYCHLWSWLAALCVVLEGVLSALHSVLGNWGGSILVLAIGVRVCMLPLSRYGMREQQAFQRKQAQIKPLLAAVKKKHKGDFLKVNEETLRIYKEYEISSLAPLKGSLPLLIQLPILFAFYQLLSNSYELRGVPFLWIEDLSNPDRLFSWGVKLPLLGDAVNVLPMVMFACHVMIAHDLTKSAMKKSSTKENNSKRTKKHQLSSYFLPLMMFVLFYSFPAGCMLYWTVGSIFQVFEQRAMRKSAPSTDQASN